jgi:hypothetical protein
VALNGEDPGVRYQLFLVLSRLKRKEEADGELAIFKRLEEARKRRDVDGGAGAGTDADLPPPPDAVVPAKEKP